MMLARLGVQMEFEQNALSNVMPSAANRSSVGVGLSGLSTVAYAPTACAVWSSDIMNSTLGRSLAITSSATTKVRRQRTNRFFINFIVLAGAYSPKQINSLSVRQYRQPWA